MLLPWNLSVVRWVSASSDRGNRWRSSEAEQRLLVAPPPLGACLALGELKEMDRYSSESASGAKSNEASVCRVAAAPSSPDRPRSRSLVASSPCWE